MALHLPDGLLLERLNADNLNYAKMLSDIYLGENMYSEERLNKIINDPGHYFFLIKDSIKYIGLFYFFIGSIEDVRKTVKSNIRKSPDEERYGVFKSIALISEYRKNRLSDRILAYFLDYLHNERGINTFYTLAWLKNNTAPAESHLVRCGFKDLGMVEKPWINDDYMYCPVCKSAPCHCNGELFEYKIRPRKIAEASKE